MSFFSFLPFVCLLTFRIHLASIILMLAFGVALLVIFAIWDLRYASLPVITPAFVKNRSVVFASLIGCFDFVRSVLSVLTSTPAD